jgi:hypothetical protein
MLSRKHEAGENRYAAPWSRRGKGFHYYLQLAGIGNRAGILPGVDYRGRGGHVVGPPSEHPDGHRYRWVNPLRDELARLPQWLIQLLVPERGPERPKGRRQRATPFDNRTGEALRRYLRTRAKYPLAATTEALWLGRNGPMTDSGVRQMMERRGRQAGVEGLHPHRFRHQFAHEWLAAGGAEQDLMR